MSKIVDPIKMNVAAAKVEACRKKLNEKFGVDLFTKMNAVYVIDAALREFLESTVEAKESRSEK